MEKHNLYSDSDYLSNIELYYTTPNLCSDNEASIIGDDYQHITKVMRHKTGDQIFVTNGLGKIFIGGIKAIDKNSVTISVIQQKVYKNKFEKVFFCLPKLKSQERFEFALEKCTELGITNFIVFESARTVSKSKKIDRWDKIIISAMKQSLRSFKPIIISSNSLNEITEKEGEKIVFEQNSDKNFLALNIDSLKNYFFIFGPEGGLTEDELDLFDKKNIFRLADNRLRTETAVIKCASLLTV
ncbi:MAG: 16S rRNA (uracil(1498)-N(3))-methyltransferase [Bacteroidetes bacterium]|nr:16S rRNA (uracil(1498)-N(3))-methyltransferase [Bacteroidota bacterium]